jgi:hypothetical protein
MANWLNSCSFVRPALLTKPTRPKRPSRPEIGRGLLAAAGLALAAAGCGHAGTSTSAGTGAAVDAPATQGSAAPLDGAADALCRPSPFGSLNARLQGAIDAEIDWASPAIPQCLGGPRPGGGGLRLLYKGAVPGTEPLLIVVGITLPPQAGTLRNVPANVTVVREGTGVFYATQGDDKCALDEVTLEPIDGSPGRYRLAGRGYCTQPARAVGTDAGAVLISRFDVAALVDAPREP